MLRKGDQEDAGNDEDASCDLQKGDRFLEADCAGEDGNDGADAADESEVIRANAPQSLGERNTGTIVENTTMVSMYPQTRAGRSSESNDSRMKNCSRAGSVAAIIV